MDYVVDFTGYYVPNKKYMIKEFCLIPIARKKLLEPKSEVVNPPYAWRRLPASYQNEYTNRFNKKYGIDYSQGNCTVNNAFNTIIDTLKQARVIYLKNESRKRFLLQFTGIPFNNVVCLDSQGYNFRSKMSPTLCSYHASKKNCCVVKEALTMAEWLLQIIFAPIIQETKFGEDLDSLEPELENAAESNVSERGSDISDIEIDASNTNHNKYVEVYKKLLKEIEDSRYDSAYESFSDHDKDLDVDSGSFVSDAINLSETQDCNDVIMNEERELNKIDDLTAGLESTQKDCDELRFDLNDSLKVPMDDYEPSNYYFSETEDLSQNLGLDEDEDQDDDDVDENNDNVDKDESNVANSESGNSDLDSETEMLGPDEDETSAMDLESRKSDSNPESFISEPESMGTLNSPDSDAGFKEYDLGTEISLDHDSDQTELGLENDSMLNGSEILSDGFDKESDFDDSSVRTLESQPLEKRFKID